jgi:hypothetical protein
MEQNSSWQTRIIQERWCRTGKSLQGFVSGENGMVLHFSRKWLIRYYFSNDKSVSQQLFG